MKKYLLLCMIFLCGCASENNTQIPETTAVESITETTVESTTETATEKKKNFPVYSVTENRVDLKLNKKVVQTLEFDQNINREYISAEDFDFDGYNDLYIPDYDVEKGTYYRYNPDMEKFEEWNELNKIGKPLTVGMSQNIGIGQILSLDTDDGQTFIYKWNGNRLNLVERCETDTDNNKIWYYIDENGNEFICEY